MHMFLHDEILALHAAAVSSGLVASRGALLAGIDAATVAGLPSAPTPSAQVLRDLDALKDAGALVDGTVPLATWLSNAVALSGKRVESAVFLAALQRCGGGPPASLAAPPEQGAHAPRQVGEDRPYDVYVSFAPEDSRFVYETLIPHLEACRLRVATSDSDAGGLGGYRVANAATGIERSKRTLLVLSAAYLRDHYAGLEAVLGMQLGLEEGRFRLVPLAVERREDLDLPLFLRSLQAAEYAHPYKGGRRALDAVAEAIKRPVPRSAVGSR